METGAFNGFLSLPQCVFTVKTPLLGFKLQSLSINSLDLDKVVLGEAHRPPAALWLTISASVTGPSV